LKIYYTNQCKRDYKKAQKQCRDIEELHKVVAKIAKRGKLADKYKDHKLAGQWKKHRACHIEPDWLLIYRIVEGTLRVERLGSHSELFK